MNLIIHFTGDLNNSKTLQRSLHLKEFFCMGNPRADCECYCKSLVATRQQLMCGMIEFRKNSRIEELSSNYKEKFTISNGPIQRSGSEESLRPHKQTRRKVTWALANSGTQILSPLSYFL